MSDVPLKKIDVARRQLVTAIRLFFGGGAPISVFALAANSCEVIDALCARSGIEGVSHHTRSHVPDGWDLKKDYVNSPFRNFFKHADRDPDEQLFGFDGTKADAIIFLSVDDYMRLMGKSPVEFQVFQLWYLAVYIEKVSAGALTSILNGTEAVFEGIGQVSRQEQLARGMDGLQIASADKQFLDDPRTEQSSWW